MNIPIKIEGATPGVINSGGVLSRNKIKLTVKALAANLPDYIIADISKLELGNKLYTSELESDNYTFLHPDNTVVCQVRTSRASIKEEEEVVETEGTEEGTEAPKEGAPAAKEGSDAPKEGGGEKES